MHIYEHDTCREVRQGPYHVSRNRIKAVTVFRLEGDSQDFEVRQSMDVQGHLWLITAFLERIEEAG